MKHKTIKVFGIGAVVLFVLMAFGPCVSAGDDGDKPKAIGHSIWKTQEQDDQGKWWEVTWLTVVFDDGSEQTSPLWWLAVGHRCGDCALFLQDALRPGQPLLAREGPVPDEQGTFRARPVRGPGAAGRPAL